MAYVRTARFTWMCVEIFASAPVIDASQSAPQELISRYLYAIVALIRAAGGQMLMEYKNAHLHWLSTDGLAAKHGTCSQIRSGDGLDYARRTE